MPTSSSLLLLLQAVVSLLVSASACAVYYVLTAPAQISLRYGLSQTLLFAATLTVCRSWLLERQHQVHCQIYACQKFLPADPVGSFHVFVAVATVHKETQPAAAASA